MFKKVRKKINKYFKRRKSETPTLPSKITHQEKQMVNIFKELLYHKNTSLEYNAKTKVMGLFLESEDVFYHIYIYDDNVRIINTVHGYDTPITKRIREYLMDYFKRKQDSNFKIKMDKANAKVNHSMDTILEKLKKNKNG